MHYIVWPHYNNNNKIKAVLIRYKTKDNLKKYSDP